MYFEIIVGTAPFAPRPDVRLKEIIYNMLCEGAPDIVKIWNIDEKNTTCRVFGDWYWKLNCSESEKENKEIVKSFMRIATKMYNSGCIRSGGIEIKK